MRDLELLLDVKAALGEGPCWDAARKLLYWVDIEGFAVHEYNPLDGKDRIIPVHQHVGAVVKCASGRLLLACRDGFMKLDPQTGELEALSDPESKLPANRFNDGKCDPAGRFWAGTMDMKGAQNQGALYRLDTDYTVHKMIDRVSCSNGLAWSLDLQTFYYIDTPTMRVMAYDYLIETGEIQNPRVAITFPEHEGSPDGMTIDNEGMLWIAHWGGWKVSRFNPQTGERLDEIPVPAEQVTSVSFGGEHMEQLYITTARVGLSEESLRNQPSAGGLFRIKPGVKGVEAFEFKG